MDRQAMVRNSDDERCTCYSNEGRPSSEKKQDRPPGGLLKGWQLTGRGPKLSRMSGGDGGSGDLTGVGIEALRYLWTEYGTFR
jgi:hypothetical protein